MISIEEVDMGVHEWGQTAAGARARIRVGGWTGPTAGLAPGYVQANLVVLPGNDAESFERYCRANPRALPLLDVTEPGSASPGRTAPDADIRLDLPRYRVYRNGRLDEEATDIMTLWHADFVAFLIGCSFTFDAMLQSNGIAMRHVDLGCNVPMYVTDRETAPVPPFSGPLVVSMRPIRREDIDRVSEATRSLAQFHGEPIHVGSPELLGISDLQKPDYGDPVPIHQDEVPVFWACGVTAQAAAEHARIRLMITHAPGHMFITDLRVDGTSND
jgi:uncharacterized protein YcsI (UPF0317 family)